MRNAAKKRLPKFEQRAGKRTSFRLTYGMLRVPVKSREERSNLETANAGVYPFGSTHETSEESFDKVYSLNVKVPYFLVAELAPLMAKRGRGAIVNLSTMVADYGAPGTSLYGSSKAAINLLTQTWTGEYGRSGVRINAVSPGPTRTEGTDSMGEGLDRLAAEAPRGVQPQPTRLPKPLSSLRRIAPVSSRARNSPWMEAEPRSNGGATSASGKFC